MGLITIKLIHSWYLVHTCGDRPSWCAWDCPDFSNCKSGILGSPSVKPLYTSFGGHGHWCPGGRSVPHASPVVMGLTHQQYAFVPLPLEESLSLLLSTFKT